MVCPNHEIHEIKCPTNKTDVTVYACTPFQAWLSQRFPAFCRWLSVRLPPLQELLGGALPSLTSSRYQRHALRIVKQSVNIAGEKKTRKKKATLKTDHFNKQPRDWLLIGWYIDHK